MDFTVTAQEFAAILMRKVAMLTSSKHRALQKAANLVRDEAKSAIGTYKYGWAQLAPSTLARKSANTPLLERGRLRASIKAEVTSENEARVYTADPNAGYHEFGTSRMPARPFLEPAAKLTEKKVHDLIGKEVERIILAG